jgi:dihydrofolate synthase/folylpolyglutamate synthase
VAAALEDSFAFDPLVGVMGVMADKDHQGVLAAFEPHLSHLVCTQNSTPRALPAEALAASAREIFGEDRVSVERWLPTALDTAVGLAESGDTGASLSAGAVLVTGSVVTVGEVRSMLRRKP